MLCREPMAVGSKSLSARSWSWNLPKRNIGLCPWNSQSISIGNPRGLSHAPSALQEDSGPRKPIHGVLANCPSDSGSQKQGCLHSPLIRLVQFSSVTQSSLTLCDPMNRSTPGLPVLITWSGWLSKPKEARCLLLWSHAGIQCFSPAAQTF